MICLRVNRPVRRGLGVLVGTLGLAALALSGCSSPSGSDEPMNVATARQADVTGDAAGAITTHWTKLGGAAVVGAATSDVLPVPNNDNARYQSFEHGVIVYSDDYGA